jgi:hypothetical protein
VPLHDFYCPACGTAFEEIVPTDAETCTCRSCYGLATRGTTGPAPTASSLLTSAARREGVADCHRELAFGHFDHSDPDTLADLDWQHHARPLLIAQHATLRQANPSLPPWSELETDLEEVYQTAFSAHAPNQTDEPRNPQ